MPLRVPISWLKDYVTLELTPEALAERLTLAGMEVEGIEYIGQHWEAECFFVAQVTAIAPHPNAERLSLVTVDYGQAQPLVVVSGAPNLRCYEEGLPAYPVKVPLAIVGATLIDPYKEGQKTFKLKPSTLRGVKSDGMICSERELGLGDDHEGVIILPSDAPVGQSLSQYFGDSILHFDIKGGFSHLMCIFGIARETAALTGHTLKREVLQGLRKHPGTITPNPPFVGLEIRDPELCTRYSALLIRGVRIGTSPMWLQQRLLNAGMRPINNVVDITNYVMLELGQPLHAFDYRILQERASQQPPNIIVRRALPKEKLTTLDNVERDLDDQMLLICDSLGPLALAGIMGGSESEVSGATVDVLLEAAHFEFLNNRRTAQILKLRTEASDRFGKRTDSDMTLTAALRAAALMVQIAGGKLDPHYGDLYLKPKTAPSIALDPRYVERLLGISISTEEIVRILTSLEFSVARGEPLHVTVPSHRNDVSIPADLVEEVARVYGYNHMQPTLMQDVLPPQRPNLRLAGMERVRDLLVAAGLDEVITYSLIDIEDHTRLNGETPLTIPFVKLKNPLAQERAYMRRQLLPQLLVTARQNLRSRKRVSLFEVGSVFHPQEHSVLPAEPRHLGIVMTGPRAQESWLTGRETELCDFYDLKGILEVLFQGLHIQNIIWKKSRKAPYHPGRCAEVLIHGEPLGFVGELHPQVIQAFELPAQSICALEINLDVLLAHWNDAHKMTEISPYEPIYEDLAFVVDESLPAEMVGSLILRVGKPLLQKVELFDMFQSEKLGEGKKSLAYALTYQASDRTLSDEDVAPLRQKIIQRLEREFNAILRG